MSLQQVTSEISINDRVLICVAAEDARLRFTLNPPPPSAEGEGSVAAPHSTSTGTGPGAGTGSAGGGLESQPDAFDQWLQAMRAAVRLPGGIPDELRRRVRCIFKLHTKYLCAIQRVF